MNLLYHGEYMRETVEEFLKRGGKVIKLKKELNTINGAYKTYDATISTATSKRINYNSYKIPEIK